MMIWIRVKRYSTGCHNFDPKLNSRPHFVYVFDVLPPLDFIHQALLESLIFYTHTRARAVSLSLSLSYTLTHTLR